MTAAKLTPDLYGRIVQYRDWPQDDDRRIGRSRARGLRHQRRTDIRRYGRARLGSARLVRGARQGRKSCSAGPRRPDLAEGLDRTAAWLRSVEAVDFATLTKRNAKPRRRSLSAIIACYMDAQAIPIMYRRLTDTLQKLDIDYEIIFVNDGSPDDCAGQILELSKSRSARARHQPFQEFRIANGFSQRHGNVGHAGLRAARRRSAGPAGTDREIRRANGSRAPMSSTDGASRATCRAIWGLLYKAFYRVFAKFSYVKIPHDAGDFSLIDRRVVGWLLQCPERDLFLRGLRAYVGFRQTGVDYFRPKRMFGESTNNLLKNLEWAKRGIFSFSNTPLKLLTAGGVAVARRVARSGIRAGDLTRSGRPSIVAARLHDGAVVFALFRGDQPVRDRPRRRICRQDHGRGQRKAATDPRGPHPQRRSQRAAA